ncbi:MAG: hypothetical protein ACOY94_09935 [Bacillota bacterium]
MDEKKQPFDPLTAVGGAAAASLTPGMIDRAAQLAERSAGAIDILVSPEVLELLEQVRRSAPALTGTIRRLDQMSRTGALDTMIDLAEVIHAAKITVSDSMVARMAQSAQIFMELIDTMQASGVPERAPAFLRAFNDARNDAAADKSFLGPFDFLQAPREEELQFVLKFMLAFARRLPGVMKSDS